MGEKSGYDQSPVTGAVDFIGSSERNRLLRPRADEPHFLEEQHRDVVASLGQWTPALRATGQHPLNITAIECLPRVLHFALGEKAPLVDAERPDPERHVAKGLPALGAKDEAAFVVPSAQ